MEEAMQYDDTTRTSEDASTCKGKGTKRRCQPHPSATSSSASSVVEVSLTATATEEEEEDVYTANCLILLAQGRPRPTEPPTGEKRHSTSRRLTVAATTTAGKAGFYVYQCKTCDRCFPSFQALGGHRTSHKKPKVTAAEAPKPEDPLQLGMMSFFSSQLPDDRRKAKVHECSICGSEFSSGQALGGHMRRHRPLQPVAAEVIKSVERRRTLPLDLNRLPAQSDEDDTTPRTSPAAAAFLESNPAPLVFSASFVAT